MRTKFLFPIFISLLTISLFVGATVAETIQETRCFSFYNFTGDYFSSVWINKYKYNAGDTLAGGVLLKNINDYPMPDMKVKAYVFYVGDTFTDRLEGNDMIDEMWIAEDVNLMPGQTYNIEFTWQIPTQSKSGFYLVTFYLLTSNQFNLGGLSFFPEIPGKSTFFEISNDNGGLMFFDKNNVTVNDNPYKFRSNVGPFEFPLTVKDKLTNLGSEAKVDVVYDLYAWDDSSEKNKIDEKTESFDLGSGESKDIVYSFPNDLDNQVYQLSIKAVAKDGRTSMIKIRLPMDTQKGRFIFLGLQDFPLVGGESNKILWCFSNSAYSSYEGKQTVEILDKSGKVLESYEFDPVTMSGTVDGASQPFSPKEPLYYVKVVGKIFDKDNNLQQQVEVVYDATKFGLEVPSFNYYLVLIPVVIAAAIALIWHWRRR